MVGFRVAIAALAAVLATLAVTGCGGSSSATTTAETPAAVTWADGVCTAITTYRSAISAAAETVKSGGVSKSGLRDAAAHVKAATQDFATTLKGLGKPETAAGATAKRTLDNLASTLQDDASAVRAAASASSGISAVADVSTTLAGTKAAVSSAFQQLKTLDPKGELKDAFSQASACSGLPS